MTASRGFESIGQFWLTSDREVEHALPGAITIDEMGSASVEVFSAIEPRTGTLLDPRAVGPESVRITGITRENKAITLDGARPLGVGGFVGGTQSTVRYRRFGADRVLIGKFYGDDEPVQFDRAAFTIELAYEWFGHSAMTAPRYSYDGALKMTIEYEERQPIPLHLTPTLSGKVWFGVKNFAPPTPWERTLDVEQNSAILLNTTDGRWSLEDIYDLAVSLQAFFALATGVPVAIQEITAWNAAEQDADESERQPRVHIPFQRYHVGKPVDRHTIPPQMPFVYSDVADYLGQLLANWLEFCETNRHAINEMMRSRYGKLTVVEHFLALTRAAEIALSKEQRKSLSPRTVSERLVREYGSEWADDVDPDLFAAAVVEYRNWYTHYDRDGRKNEPDVDYGEIGRICDNLGAMLDVYMIARCVPDAVDWRTLLRRDGEIAWTLRRSLEFHPKHQRTDASHD